MEPATTNEDDGGGDLEEWRRLFTAGYSKEHKGGASGGEGGSLPPFHHLTERARSLAASILLEAELPDRMEADGTMQYHLRQPIGGHGMSYVDVLYLDGTLRVLRGHHGTLYVSARVPTVPED